MAGAGAMVTRLGAIMAPARVDMTLSVLVWEGDENPAAFKSLTGVSLRPAYPAANEDTITRTASPGAFDLLTIYQGMIDPLRKMNRIEPIANATLPIYIWGQMRTGITPSVNTIASVV